MATVLGQGGRVVSLIQGTYGEVFPDGSQVNADDPILALRSVFPDGRQITEPVPATLDDETEKAAELVYEPYSGVTYVFWQGWINSIHSRFKIAAFNGETWDETIEVSGSAFAWRTSPSFAVSRDTYARIDSEQEAVPTIHRTILHILWSEAADDGGWLTKYVPLVLENGTYLGSHPVIVLNDLIPVADASAAWEDLTVAPQLRLGDSGNSVIAAFLDQHSTRLATVELRFAAGELSLLGDAVAAVIADEAASADVETPAGAKRLLSKVDARLSSFESQVKPEVLAPLKASVEDFLEERVPGGSGGVASIQGDARAHLINFGFRLTDGKTQRITADARAHLINFGVRNEVPRPHLHDVRSSVASARALPEGLPSAPEIVVSANGANAILAWREDGRVLYRQSNNEAAWGETQQLRITTNLGQKQAFAILQQRVEQ